MARDQGNKWTEILENLKAPLRIVTVYVIFGGLWILFSDSLLGYLVTDPNLFIRISTIKGWLYVLVTGLLLLKLIEQDFSRIRNLNQELSTKNHELISSNQEIHALYEEMAASEETLQASYNELQRYQERLEASDERYRLVMQASQEGFWDYRPSEHRLEISNGFGRIFGAEWDGQDNVIEKIMERVHTEDRHKMKRFTGELALPEDQSHTETIRIHHENGSYRWTEFQGLALRDDNGVTHRIIGAIRDIHEKILQQERIEYYAFHDPSTGFHNRDYMLEQLHKRFKNMNAGTGPLDFLVVGIQGMERISSVYGTNIAEIIHYQVGMAVWKAVGQGEGIAMLGLGRFGIILEGSEDDARLMECLEAIDVLTLVPIRINQLSVSVQMAYGVARCSGAMTEPEILVQQAETAFAHAMKERVREHVVWYDPVLQEEKNYLGKVEFMLRQAFDADEFTLVFQPQTAGIDEEQTAVKRFEVLSRWHNAELGVISPEVFIPVAEATGQIDGIGEFVIANTCRFLRTYMDRTGQEIKVSINASLMELMNPEYIHRLLRHLEYYHLQPKHLGIEITESALAKYLDSVIENLKVLQERGFEIHLDDFGTGYSSLNHLGRLPVHALKIDRTFVWQMEEDPRMKQMTELIVQVGHLLDLQIIAEGVETEAQYRMLQAMGCDSYQGYYFSKPIPERELLESI